MYFPFDAVESVMKCTVSHEASKQPSLLTLQLYSSAMSIFYFNPVDYLTYMKWNGYGEMRLFQSRKPRPVLLM